MTQLRMLLLTLAVLSFWFGVVATTPMIHRAIFALVPADGSLTQHERAELDRDVTALITTFKANTHDYRHVDRLSQVEQAHLEDVFSIVSLVIFYLLPGSLIGLFLVRCKLTEPLAFTWSLGLIGLIGLISATMFQPLFVGMHRLFFPQGGWQLPSDQYLLTQVYPLGFFIVAWTIILLLSIGTLLVLRTRTGSKQ